MKKKTYPINLSTPNKKVADDYVAIARKLKDRVIPIGVTIPAFLVDKLKEEEKNNFENLKKYI